VGYFVSLNFRKPKSNTPKSEVLGVVLNYYYQKKKLRKSIGVEVKLKDWNFDEQEYPVRKSDPHYKTVVVVYKGLDAAVQVMSVVTRL
jgi:hypothetical protein